MNSRYIIQIAGHLDPHWSEWFDSMQIAHQSDGTTSITSDAIDQAALYGLLARVRDLGLTLLAVRLVGLQSD